MRVCRLQKHINAISVFFKLRLTAWMLGHTTWQHELSADDCSAPSLPSFLPACDNWAPRVWTAELGCFFGVYLSDLRTGSFVRLQLVQDALRILQHHVHLLPHLPLRFCGLGVCRKRTKTTTERRSRPGTCDWSVVQNLLDKIKICCR